MRFAVESFSDIRDEIMPLWQRHYDEIAEDQERVPLDPDWDKYDRLAVMGALQIVTARTVGQLVGYAFVVVDTHLHYRTTLFAVFDLYYVAPEHRGGRTALRLFQAVERHLASLGVVKAIANTKLAHDHGRLFQFMGWREAERLFVKSLGAA
jgi:GNAT superfamily N-acetyltransferase